MKKAIRPSETAGEAKISMPPSPPVLKSMELIFSAGVALVFQDDERAVGRGEVDLAVGPDGRAFADASGDELPVLLAAHGVEAVQNAAIAHHVQPPAVQQRRSEAGVDAVAAPQLVGLGHVAVPAAVDADHAAHERAVVVLFAVRDIDPIAVNHRRRVQPALAGREAPDLFAGAGLDGVQAAVGIAGDDQPLAVDHGHHGIGVGGVFRLAARGAPPEDLAAVLVEGQEAMRPHGMRAEAGVVEGHDHAVFIDERGVGPSAVAADATEELGQRLRPEELAVTVETENEALHAVGIDVAGLGIDGHAGPADAAVGHVGMEAVELVVPEVLAGRGIEGEDLLLLGDAFAAEVDSEEAAARHDRRRAAAGGDAREDVLGGTGQSRFQRHAVLIRPAQAAQSPPKAAAAQSKPASQNPPSRVDNCFMPNFS